MHFVNHAGTFSLDGRGLAHLNSSWGFPCICPRFLCEAFVMTPSRSWSAHVCKGLCSVGNMGSKEEVLWFIFISLVSLPRHQGWEAMGWRFVLWANLNHRETMKGNEQFEQNKTKRTPEERNGRQHGFLWNFPNSASRKGVINPYRSD